MIRPVIFRVFSPHETLYGRMSEVSNDEMSSYHTAMQLYLVITLRTPGFDPAVIPAHYAFLEDLQGRGVLAGYGPFADKSGGAYLLKAQSLAQAQALAFADPVHTSGSSQVSVREWQVTWIEATS